jgi:hypothetical protein
MNCWDVDSGEPLLTEEVAIPMGFSRDGSSFAGSSI